MTPAGSSPEPSTTCRPMADQAAAAGRGRLGHAPSGVIRVATWRDLVPLVWLALAAERRTRRAGRQGVVSGSRLPGQAGLHAVTVALHVLLGVQWTTADRAAAAAVTARTRGRLPVPGRRLGIVAAGGAGGGALLAGFLPIVPWPLLVALAGAAGWLVLLLVIGAIEERRPPRVQTLAASIGGGVWELANAVSRGRRSGAPLFRGLVAKADGAGVTFVLRTAGPERVAYYAT